MARRSGFLPGRRAIRLQAARVTVGRDFLRAVQAGFPADGRSYALFGRIAGGQPVLHAVSLDFTAGSRS
jgi:hypothetical protein